MAHHTLSRPGILLLLAACGQDMPTLPSVRPDPDFSGRYQGVLQIGITDSVLQASWFSASYRVLLNAECPSEWIVRRTGPREYAVDIRVFPRCLDLWGRAADYVTLASTFAGVLRIETVTDLPTALKSSGTMTVENGSASDFETITGCSAANVGSGWQVSFQSFIRHDNTWTMYHAWFLPRVYSPVSGHGAFRTQCRGIGGLFMSLVFGRLMRIG